MGRGRISKWESELWSYVRDGNGTHCPLIHQCEAKPNFVNFPDSCEHLQQLIDNDQSTLNDVDVREIQTWGERSCRILDLVEKLAESYVEMGKINSPPVPTALIGLLEPQNPVEVRLVPLMSYHGAIWRMNDGSWVIQINKNDPPSRQRLSIFHEVFHILAHRKGAPVFRTRESEEGCFNEMLADYFAVCILMPRQLVGEKWAEVNDLKRMANVFDVPRTSMAFRLKQLDLI